MAEYDNNAPPVAEAANAAIKREVKRRVTAADQEYRMFEVNFREAYSFMMPYRVRPGFEQNLRLQDASENFSTLGEEVTTDFSSDMADTFTPEHSKWGGIEVAESVPEELQQDAKDAADAETKTIFDAITASNFHEACKQGNKDLAVSAYGLAIEDPGAGEPFHCQVIPINELRILRAVKGGIGTRFWTRNLKADEIADTFPHLKDKFPPKVVAALACNKLVETKFRVLQGCYRDYSVRAETAWICFTMIDGEVCESARAVGFGSSNILVCRWDPDPSFAWGNGPGIKALADFRQLDETSYLKLKGMARQIDPTVVYDDDSVINLDGGLPNGVAIPRLSGSKIDVIESKHSIDAGVYAVQEVVDRIRRHFYLDEPEQPGKTPPTLGQWMDESLRRQRRLGTPASPIWPEFLAEAFMRFRYLLVKRGTLKSGLPVGEGLLTVRPMNPLKRAAQQEEAASCERVLSTFNGLFGTQMLPRIIDVGATCNKLVDLSFAKGVVMRKPADINKSIEDMMKAEMAAQAAKMAGPAASAIGALKGGQ